MKKAFAFAVIVIILILASVGTALAIHDTIGGAKGDDAVSEKAFAENGGLGIYVQKDWIPNLPKGVPADTALALVRGTRTNFTMKYREETRYLFSFPIEKETAIISRFISYQQKGWNEKYEISLPIVKNDWSITFLVIILPILGILVIAKNNQKKKKREIKLAISFSVILLYTALGGFAATPDIFLLGAIACAITGFIAGGTRSMFAAVFAGSAGGWFINQALADNANQYFLLITVSCALSYLVAWIVGKNRAEMEVTKHKRVMERP